MARYSGIHLPSQLSQDPTNRRITVQASPGMQGDPISKLTDTKRAGRVAFSSEYLKKWYLRTCICVKARRLYTKLLTGNMLLECYPLILKLERMICRHKKPERKK
jgi:hypothetical protein